MRRIGALHSGAAEDPNSNARNAVFLQNSTIGLDRWPQRADRRSLGRGRCRIFADMLRNW